MMIDRQAQLAKLELEDKASRLREAGGLIVAAIVVAVFAVGVLIAAAVPRTRAAGLGGSTRRRCRARVGGSGPSWVGPGCDRWGRWRRHRRSRRHGRMWHGSVGDRTAPDDGVAGIRAEIVAARVRLVGTLDALRYKADLPARLGDSVGTAASTFIAT